MEPATSIEAMSLQITNQAKALVEETRKLKGNVAQLTAEFETAADLCSGTLDSIADYMHESNKNVTVWRSADDETSKLLDVSLLLLSKASTEQASADDNAYCTSAAGLTSDSTNSELAADACPLSPGHQLGKFSDLSVAQIKRVVDVRPLCVCLCYLRNVLRLQTAAD
jgi:hypothetical protein